MKKKTTDPPDHPITISEDALMVRLIEHLSFLQLPHTKSHLAELLVWARRQQPDPLTLLEHVLGQEVGVKRPARIEQRINRSGMRERKRLEVFDWDFQPTIDKPTVLELARLDFIKHAEDIIINGKPGTGKSHILKAICLLACERGVSCRYALCTDLIDDLHAGLADGTYPKRLRTWTKPKLLVIDDVGIGHLKKRDDEPTAAHTLYNLVDRRHGCSSTAITSNIELSEWGSYLGDAIITRAILDRLVMNAIRMRIDGPSFRKRVAEQRAAKRAEKRNKTSKIAKQSTKNAAKAKVRVPS